MKVKYVCTWDKDKKNTWSGTTYSLYNSLKKYIDIDDCGIYINKIKKLYFKLRNVKIMNGKLYTRNLYNKFEEKAYQHKINKIDQKKENACMLEVFDLGKTENIPYYIYQDLSIDFLIDYKKNKENLFKYSGFQNYSIDDLEFRRKKQFEIYDSATGIFTMSKFLEKHLIDYSHMPKDKVHYVGAGINLPQDLIKREKKENKKILFVGRDFYRKGGDLVCNAFNILKNKYKSDAELYIIGPSKEISKNYRNYKDIFFLGNLDSNQLSYYFNKCDIFCMPSRFEAYGIVFIEALTYGLPCIGRNEFAMNEFIKDGQNGYLVDNDDEEILALKMHQLLENKEIKENVLNDYHYYREEYSWDNVIKRIKGFIKEIV